MTPAPCPEPDPVILQGFKEDPPACVAEFVSSGDFNLEAGIWAAGVIQGAEAATMRQNCIKQVHGWIQTERKLSIPEGANNESD